MMHKLGKSCNCKESLYNGFLMSLVYEDKVDYAKYKSGSSEGFSEERVEQMEVLNVLEKLSFPMDEVGTYFFKDMIVKAKRYLNGTDDFGREISQEELLQELQDPFSQFYFDLARNELDIGLKTFHTTIEHALESVDYEKADTTLLLEIYSNFSKETDYGEHALMIAKHMNGASKKTSGYQYTLVSPVNIQVGI
ncbi:MAG: hypothetical protein J6C28_06850 [Bacilli bacterium]|nr:hypothetical protein [Bacilli bacterium]